LIANHRLSIDFIASDQPQEQKFSDGLSRSVPSQPIASRTRWQAVLRSLRSALSSLNEMINLPVTLEICSPATLFEGDGIATKVAVTFRSLEDIPKLRFSYSYLRQYALRANGSALSGANPHAIP
jgi:hypothetical protein